MRDERRRNGMEMESNSSFRFSFGFPLGFEFVFLSYSDSDSPIRMLECSNLADSNAFWATQILSGSLRDTRFELTRISAFMVEKLSSIFVFACAKRAKRTDFCSGCSPVCQPVCLRVCPSVRPFICLYSCPSVCPPVGLTKRAAGRIELSGQREVATERSQQATSESSLPYRREKWDFRRPVSQDSCRSRNWKPPVESAELLEIRETPELHHTSSAV